ncbi:hypothetical protein JCM5353_000606 [Sporobolomyces roseus]
MSRGVLPKDSMENLAGGDSLRSTAPQRRRTIPEVVSVVQRRDEELQKARSGQPSEASKSEVYAEIRHNNRVFNHEVQEQEEFGKHWRKHASPRILKADTYGEWYDRNVKGMTLSERGGVNDAKEILKDVLDPGKQSKKGDSNLNRASTCSLSHIEQAHGSVRRAKIYGQNASAL